MEARNNASRSSLFSRRMHSETAAQDGARVGRYDRNRFAKLDLGKNDLTLESIRAGISSLYDSGKAGLYDSGRSVLYEGGRNGTSENENRAGIYSNRKYDTLDSGLEGGRTGMSDNESRAGMYSNRNFDTLDSVSAGLGGSVRTDALRGRNTSGQYENEGLSERLKYSRRLDDYDEGLISTVDICGNDEIAAQEDHYRRDGRSGRSSPDHMDVVYYRIIDNYTIWKLETVEPAMNSSGTMTSSSSAAATPPMTPSSVKSFPLMSLRSVDVPLHKKTNLIKNLQVLIEELQQKVARLQLEVEGQDTGTSFSDSKYGSNQQSDFSAGCLSSPSSSSSLCSLSSGTFCETRPSATGGEQPSSAAAATVSECDVSCRHLRELEKMKKLNDTLQREKFHLEEQIVQLRSVKSIVHGTDSEKTVTKLEAENLQLQNQLKESDERLQQMLMLLSQRNLSNSSSFPSSTKHNTHLKSLEVGDCGVVSQPKFQEYETKTDEIEARLNDVMERLKERHKLGGDVRPGTKQPPAGGTGKEEARSHRQVMHDGLKNMTSEVQHLAGELMQAKHQCTVLQKWLTGQVQNVMLQMRQMLMALGRGGAIPQLPVIGEAMRIYSCPSSCDPGIANRNKNYDVAHTSSSPVNVHDVQKGKKKKKKKKENGEEVMDMEENEKMEKLVSDTWNVGINQVEVTDEARTTSRTLETRVGEGSVRVVCRIRPTLKDETGACECVLSPLSDSNTLQLLYRGRLKTFEVDDIITANETQETVFHEVKRQMSLCLTGNNVSVIAYGETGSGKTLTIQGTPENPGLVRRAAALLLDESQKHRDDGIVYKLTMSILEIYNDSLRDLLGADPSVKLEAKPSAEGGISIAGLTQVELQSESFVCEMLKRSEENRILGPCRANDHSSRSHLVITIAATGFNSNNNTTTNGRIVLVDLAGSERMEKTGMDPVRYKEAQSINKTLTCLGDVLYALVAKQAHVPFRSSRLTHVLQDSLGGKTSSTVLVVHLAATEKRASETMSSLMFAQRVRSVDTSSATTTTVKGQGSSDGGSSGSRTPVEPISQRPRRPSGAGVGERLAVFTSERRSSVSSSSSERKATATPGSVKRTTGGVGGANLKNSKRDRSESRNDDGRTSTTTSTPVSRPKSTLKLFIPTTTRK